MVDQTTDLALLGDPEGRIMIGSGVLTVAPWHHPRAEIMTEYKITADVTAYGTKYFFFG